MTSRRLHPKELKGVRESFMALQEQKCALYKAYHAHRHRCSHGQKIDAAGAPVKFLLTFEEWSNLWEDKWLQRGQGRNKYCMARHNDLGHYELGNVAIITNRENARSIGSDRQSAARLSTSTGRPPLSQKEVDEMFYSPQRAKVLANRFRVSMALVYMIRNAEHFMSQGRTPIRTKGKHS